MALRGTDPHSAIMTPKHTTEPLLMLAGPQHLAAQTPFPQGRAVKVHFPQCPWKGRSPQAVPHPAAPIGAEFTLRHPSAALQRGTFPKTPPKTTPPALWSFATCHPHAMAFVLKICECLNEELLSGRDR